MMNFHLSPRPNSEEQKRPQFLPPPLRPPILFRSTAGNPRRENLVPSTQAPLTRQHSFRCGVDGPQQIRWRELQVRSKTPRLGCECSGRSSGRLGGGLVLERSFNGGGGGDPGGRERGIGAGGGGSSGGTHVPGF